MTLYNQDFDMVAGDDKTLRFTITDEDGDPLDLLSADLTWVLSKDARDALPMVLKSNDDGISVSGAANNVISVHLEPEDTINLAGLYTHDLEAVELPGVSPIVSTLAAGTGRIRRALPRP